MYEYWNWEHSTRFENVFGIDFENEVERCEVLPPHVVVDSNVRSVAAYRRSATVICISSQRLFPFTRQSSLIHIGEIWRRQQLECRNSSIMSARLFPPLVHVFAVVYTVFLYASLGLTNKVAFLCKFLPSSYTACLIVWTGGRIMRSSECS